MGVVCAYMSVYGAYFTLSIYSIHTCITFACTQDAKCCLNIGHADTVAHAHAHARGAHALTLSVMTNCLGECNKKKISLRLCVSVGVSVGVRLFFLENGARWGLGRRVRSSQSPRSRSLRYAGNQKGESVSHT